MTYQPGYVEVVPPYVSTATRSWGPADDIRVSGVPASATWESADRAVYYPLRVPVTCTIRRFWWANGSTVSATYNVDCGLYADAGYKPGARIISTGNTAQGTSTNVQFADVTDTVISPGRYWLALACSSASATFFRATMGASSGADAAVRMEEASARPLPATATPTESSIGYVYLFGFATTASP